MASFWAPPPKAACRARACSARDAAYLRAIALSKGFLGRAQDVHENGRDRSRFCRIIRAGSSHGRETRRNCWPRWNKSSRNRKGEQGEAFSTKQKKKGSPLRIGGASTSSLGKRGRIDPKAYELKSELDRLNVFQEYENRFLDLFKKPEA